MVKDSEKMDYLKSQGMQVVKKLTPYGYGASLNREFIAIYKNETMRFSRKLYMWAGYPKHVNIAINYKTLDVAILPSKEEKANTYTVNKSGAFAFKSIYKVLRRKVKHSIIGRYKAKKVFVEDSDRKQEFIGFQFNIRKDRIQ